MIKDISTTEKPLRSRLFNPPMRGECGATQESLLSYAHRLSAEHHLPVRLMMTEVLMPASGLDTLLTSVGKVKTVDPRALHSVNGAAAGAAKFANGLAGLTSRRDLANGTFLHWANLLSHRVPMAASRRWCPHCIADQREHHFVAFGLLWTPKVAQACPSHRVLLEDRCAQCQALQPILGDEPTRGLCWKCHACLGSVQQCQKTRPAGERDQFIAEAIAEMIEMRPNHLGIEGLRPLSQQFHRIAEEQFGLSVYKLARRLKMSEHTLAPGRRLTVSVFVEVAYRLGLKPRALLLGSEEATISARAVADVSRQRRRMTSLQVQMLREAVSGAVRELTQWPNRTIVVLDLAGRFDVPTRALYAHCADSMKVVQAHNVVARPVMRADRMDQVAMAARSAMRDLVAQGGTLTLGKINKVLADAGVHWSLPEARAAANDELDTLLRRVA